MKSLLTGAAVLFFSFAVQAEDQPRAIDFTTVLTDQDGEPFLECTEPTDRECKSKRPVTLGLLAMRALAATEQNLPPEDALKRGQLALTVYKASAAKLTVEEIASVKKQIAKSFGPIIVVRAFALLDPPSVKP